MLTRLKELAARRADFAFETTLASKTFSPWIATLLQADYTFHLVYLWLPSPDVAVARVHERVRLGGHDVPEATIRRRYAAGLRNFFGLYRPMATSWAFFDNAALAGPSLIAEGRGPKVTDVQQTEVWANLCEAWAHE